MPKKKIEIDVVETISEISETLSKVKDPKTREQLQKIVADRIKDPKMSEEEKWLRLRASVLFDKDCAKIVQEIDAQKEEEFGKRMLEYDFEQAVDEYLQNKELPKTTSEERVKVLENANTLYLDKRRQLITEKEGLDPDPVFLGRSEDGKQDIYEMYIRCRECKKVFKSFKGNQAQIFCSSKCRQEWYSKNMHTLNEIENAIEAENNSETWDWQRIGSKSDKELGTYGIFRKVFSDGQ